MVKNDTTRIHMTKAVDYTGQKNVAVTAYREQKFRAGIIINQSKKIQAAKVLKTFAACRQYTNN